MVGALAGAEPVAAEVDDFVLGILGLRWHVRLIGVPAPVAQSLRHLWQRAIVLGHRAPAASRHDEEPRDYLIAPTDAVLEEAGLTIDERCLIGTDDRAAPYTVSRALTLASILRRRGEALMLHAVGVCGPDGRTVALVAPSGTGKTTAAGVLCRPLGYVTDETVVIEADDRISPYPKPLSIITDTARPHSKDESSPDDLGLGPTPEEPTLAGIVVMRRDPDLQEPEFELVPLVEALLATIPETSALPALPDPLARLSRALCTGGGPFALRYAEITDCVDLVDSLTRPDAEREATSPEWEHHPKSVRELPEAPTQVVTWESVLTRCGWDDAVTSEGETVILHDYVPSRLSRLGTNLWLRADEPTPVATLHDAIVADMGKHPRSQALVLDGLQVLVDAGVLRIVAVLDRDVTADA